MLKLGCTDVYQERINAIVKQHGTGRDKLLPILHSVQDKFSCIDPDAQQIIADLLNIHAVEVNSVVSFYAFLYDKVGGRFRIKLCCTISCELAGTPQITDWLKNVLGISYGETTTDGMFSLEHAACIGMCDQGPALLVNDQVHTQVTVAKLKTIIENCRKESTLEVGMEAG